MRTLLALALVVAMLLSVTPIVLAQSTADEAAVREATKQFMAAFNKHDVEAVAALLDDNCETWTGAIKGKDALTKMYADRFERMKDLHVELLEELGVVFLTPDVAVHKFYEGSSGWLDADGNPEPPGKGLRAYTYVKKNGAWLRGAMCWRSEEE